MQNAKSVKKSKKKVGKKGTKHTERKIMTSKERKKIEAEEAERISKQLALGSSTVLHSMYDSAFLEKVADSREAAKILDKYANSLPLPETEIQLHEIAKKIENDNPVIVVPPSREGSVSMPNAAADGFVAGRSSSMNSRIGSSSAFSIGSDGDDGDISYRQNAETSRTTTSSIDGFDENPKKITFVEPQVHCSVILQFTYPLFLHDEGTRDINFISRNRGYRTSLVLPGESRREMVQRRVSLAIATVKAGTRLRVLSANNKGNKSRGRKVEEISVESILRGFPLSIDPNEIMASMSDALEGGSRKRSETVALKKILKTKSAAIVLELCFWLIFVRRCVSRNRYDHDLSVEMRKLKKSLKKCEKRLMKNLANAVIGFRYDVLSKVPLEDTGHCQDFFPHVLSFAISCAMREIFSGSIKLFGAEFESNVVTDISAMFSGIKRQGRFHEKDWMLLFPSAFAENGGPVRIRGLMPSASLKNLGVQLGSNNDKDSGTVLLEFRAARDATRVKGGPRMISFVQRRWYAFQKAELEEDEKENATRKHAIDSLDLLPVPRETKKRNQFDRTRWVASSKPMLSYAVAPLLKNKVEMGGDIRERNGGFAIHEISVGDVEAEMERAEEERAEREDRQKVREEYYVKGKQNYDEIRLKIKADALRECHRVDKFQQEREKYLEAKLVEEMEHFDRDLSYALNGVSRTTGKKSTASRTSTTSSQATGFYRWASPESRRHNRLAMRLEKEVKAVPIAESDTNEEGFEVVADPQTLESLAVELDYDSDEISDLEHEEEEEEEEEEESVADSSTVSPEAVKVTQPHRSTSPVLTEDEIAHLSATEFVNWSRSTGSRPATAQLMQSFRDSFAVRGSVIPDVSGGTPMVKHDVSQIWRRSMSPMNKKSDWMSLQRASMLPRVADQFRLSTNPRFPVRLPSDKTPTISLPERPRTQQAHRKSTGSHRLGVLPSSDLRRRSDRPHTRLSSTSEYDNSRDDLKHLLRNVPLNAATTGLEERTKFDANESALKKFAVKRLGIDVGPKIVEKKKVTRGARIWKKISNTIDACNEAENAGRHRSPTALNLERARQKAEKQ